MLNNYDLGYSDGYEGLPPERPESINYMGGYIDGETDRSEEEWEEDDYDPYSDWGPMDDIPWGTPDSWIPDNPDENGMRDSDFI